LLGCQTTAPLPPVNLSEPGWKLYEGQVLWRSSHDAPEIAGEILVANHPDNRAWIQFVKTPLPLVTAQMNERKWQIEFIPEKRKVTGHDQPPARFIWLHLLRALNGVPPDQPLQFSKDPDGSWRLENKLNGEVLSGYLNPQNSTARLRCLAAGRRFPFGPLL
jgi:hypothetical protein